MRRTTLLAGLSLSLAGTVALALPAFAAEPESTPRPQHSHVQTLSVPDDVAGPSASFDTFGAVNPDVPALLAAAAPALDAGTRARTAAALGPLPGVRLSIVGTALGYLGTPYVLGGASRSGIDCSGLTMRAYEAAGVSLAHYVPTQDAAGVRIDEASAEPGDLVVFDDEEHVAVYLGDDTIVAAPSPGRPVQIEALSQWAGIGHHFTRILKA